VGSRGDGAGAREIAETIATIAKDARKVHPEEHVIVVAGTREKPAQPAAASHAEKKKRRKKEIRPGGRDSYRYDRSERHMAVVVVVAPATAWPARLGRADKVYVFLGNTLVLVQNTKTKGACLLRMVFKPEVQTWSESGVGTFEFQCS
jgi:hypothetical protein